MRKKILVVEDDGDLLELLSYTLKRAGFAVGTARDGLEALRKARSMSPDLVLLDVLLPEMDGYAVCETLRRQPNTANTRILMLSALSSQLARLTGIGAGADDYLAKPFSPKKLLARVQELVAAMPGREQQA